ncbi:MAG: BLUF domain-containing protein [Chitinophagaceae bacterium]
MHNLIYLSSATYLFTKEDITDILTKSRSNNTSLNITGLLLYHEGSILQILEGEKDTLYTLLKTINKDTRHKGIITMIDEAIDERNFDEWSMGFKQVSKGDWSELQGYLNLNDKNGFKRITSSGSSKVVSLIKSFGNVNNLR